MTADYLHHHCQFQMDSQAVWKSHEIFLVSSLSHSLQGPCQTFSSFPNLGQSLIVPLISLPAEGSTSFLTLQKKIVFKLELLHLTAIKKKKILVNSKPTRLPFW